MHSLSAKRNVMKNLLELRNEISSEIDSKPRDQSLFDIKTANQYIEIAKNRPIPNMLFGEFWFEGEICILFADTNLGKSILAVQIGNSISTGISTCGLRIETPPAKILYFDFELSDKQFENRYSTDYKDHFKFSDNFLRAEIDPNSYDDSKFKSTEEHLYYSLEESIKSHDVKILIIDNITYLKNDNEKSKDALPLMKLLKELKTRYDLSILVLAHTPKIDIYKPLNKNHLSGSKMLMNFCDSSFAIGQSSQETGLRYLKQIKQRSTEEIYSCENVIICKIEKVESFLQFSFIGYGNELDHLRQSTDEDRGYRDSRIAELKKQGLSNVAVGKEIGCSEGTVRATLLRLDL